MHGQFVVFGGTDKQDNLSLTFITDKIIVMRNLIC